jgi:hypothetical protein
LTGICDLIRKTILLGAKRRQGNTELIMLPLEQLLWIFSAMGCGSLVALWSHFKAWRMREQTNIALPVLGVAFVLLVLLVVWLIWIDIGSKYWEQETHAYKRWMLLLITIGFFLIVAIISLIQRWHMNVNRDFAPISWSDVYFSLLGEVFLTMSFCWLFTFCLTLIYAVASSYLYFRIEWFGLDPYRWFRWYFDSCASTLFLLALMRPYVAKMHAQFLQTRREWFRLK